MRLLGPARMDLAGRGTLMAYIVVGIFVILGLTLTVIDSELNRRTVAKIQRSQERSIYSGEARRQAYREQVIADKNEREARRVQEHKMISEWEREIGA